MIPLDDDRWQTLEHAYGPAGNVPRLLEQLAANPRPKTTSQAEPWHTLWSELCPQGNVYSASYAAVPHIVAIALASETLFDSSFFRLPACIEIARASGRGSEISDDLCGPYRTALDQLHDCAARLADHDWTKTMTISIAAALAAAKGHVTAAQVIVNLDDDLIERIISEDL